MHIAYSQNTETATLSIGTTGNECLNLRRQKHDFTKRNRNHRAEITTQIKVRQRTGGHIRVIQQSHDKGGDRTRSEMKAHIEPMESLSFVRREGICIICYIPL